MRKVKFFIFIPLLLAFVSLNAGTLEQAYQNASPGLGYDKLIILNPIELYTGGITIVDEKVGIKGNGAVIDLMGGQINVSGSSVIEVDGCIIINGSYGLNIDGNVNALITQSTFYGNNMGIYYMCTAGEIEVYNTIISNNTEYGFACHEASLRTLHYMDTYQNNGGNYMEFCPG
jgi:hypothetical protein